MTATTDIPVNGDGTYDEPTWGEGGAAFSVPPFEATGYAGVALPSNDVNYEWQHLARWLRATAITRSVPSDASLFTSFLFPGSGTWTTGGGTLNSSIGASWAMIDADDDGGVVVQFNVPVGSPHLFTASRDTYVNLNEAGAVEYQAVANGAGAPSPTAGYVAVWKVVTDGTEITAATVRINERPSFRDVFVQTLGIMGDLAVTGTLEVTGATTLSSTLEVTGDTDLTGELDVTSAGTFHGGLAVEGLVTAFGETAALVVDGDAVVTGDFEADTLAVTGNASIGGVLDMTSGNITNVVEIFCTTVTASGDVDCSGAVTALTLEATGAITCGGNLDMTSGVIANCTTITSTNVAPTNVNFTTTTPSITNGREVYNGRRLSVGDGVTARRIHSPVTAYVVSDSTAASSEDITGAFIAMNVAPTEWIYLRVSALQTVSVAGDDPNISLTATNGFDLVNVLNAGDADQAHMTLPTTVANDDRRPNGFTVRWRPTNDIAVPNNDSWTIQVQHGITGAPTVTSTNVFLEGWYE